MRRSNLVIVLALLLVGVFSAGCSTLVSSRTASVPRGAATAVIIVDETGRMANPGFAQNYLYDALMSAGLKPIALNEADVSGVLASVQTQLRADEAAETPMAAPAMLKTLLEQLDGVSYLIVMEVWASGLDEDMRALVIDVGSQEIIAVHHYEHRAMAALWGTLSPLWGASLVVVPWFYLRDSAAAEHELLAGFLQQLVDASQQYQAPQQVQPEAPPPVEAEPAPASTPMPVPAPVPSPAPGGSRR
jgi:hypothetical protein